jgi:8-hydroxy-5-deazaflavin:NADPH oxidoreductase
MSYAIIGAGKAGQALARAFTRKGLVKTFNHLSAATLAQDPNVKGGRRVLFLSTDDERAAARVAKLVEELGFAPVKLGKLTREVCSCKREDVPGLISFSRISSSST